MKPVSKYRLFVENSQYIYLATLVTEVFGFIVSIFVIRKLSVETYGTFNFLIASFFIFRVIGISSVSSLFNRFIPEMAEKKEFSKLKKFLNHILSLSVLILLLLILLLSFTKIEFGTFFGVINFEEFFAAFIVFLVARYLMSVAENILSSLLLNKALAIYKMIRSAVSPVVYLVFLPILDVNIMLLIEGFFCMMIVLPSSIKIYSYIKENIQDNVELNSGKIYKKRMLRYGLFSSLDQLGVAVIGRTSDYFIISAIASQYSVGLFSFAHKLFSMLDRAIPINEILNTVRPLFIQKFSNGFDEKKFNDINNLIIKLILPVYFIPFLLFLIFGEGIIKFIYDPKYLASYWLTLILFFAPVLIMFYYPTILLVQLKEKVEYQLLTNVLAVFSIVGGIFFMKWFGLVGIVVATSIGNFLRKFIMYLLMKRDVKIEFRLSELKNYLFISLVLLITFYFLELLVVNIISLIAAVALFGIVALLLLVLFHPFKEDEIAFLNNLAGASKPLSILKPAVIKIHNLKTLIPKFGF